MSRSPPYFTRLGAVLYPQRACNRESRSLNACWAGAVAQESTHDLTQSLWHDGAHGERPQHSTAHAVCLSGAAQAATCASLAESDARNVAAAIRKILSSVRLTDTTTSNARTQRAPHQERGSPR